MSLVLNLKLVIGNNFQNTKLHAQILEKYLKENGHLFVYVCLCLDTRPCTVFNVYSLCFNIAGSCMCSSLKHIYVSYVFIFSYLYCFTI